MESNRPRPSLLLQFDPFFEPESDHIIPDSEEENKENLNITALLSSSSKHEYAQPAVLTRRLIDIGDETVAEIAEEDVENVVENDENGENAFLSPETPKRTEPACPIPRSTPRTPLADISLDNQSKFISPPNKISDSPSRPTKADNTSPLSSLVDSVNRAGKTFGQIHLPPPRVVIEDSDDAAPSLMATPAPFNLQVSILSHHDEDEDLGSSFLTPPSLTASKASNRLSLDLQASFNLHASPETSFDLLKDRISFFDAQGRDAGSFLNTSDDGDSDFDIFTDNAVHHDSEDDSTSPLDSSSTCNARSEGLQSPISLSPDVVLTKLNDLSLSAQSDISTEPVPLVFGPLIKQTNSTVTPALHRTVTATVPALRIVKRTHGRTTSSNSSSSTSTQSATVLRKPSPPPSTVEISVPAAKTSTRSIGAPVRAVVAADPSGSSKGATRPLLPRVGASTVSFAPKKVLLGDVNATTSKPTVNLAPSATLGRPKTSAVPTKPTSTNGVTSKLPAPSGIARFGVRKTSVTIAPSAASGASNAGTRRAPVRGLPRRQAS